MSVVTVTSSSSYYATYGSLTTNEESGEGFQSVFDEQAWETEAETGSFASADDQGTTATTTPFSSIVMKNLLWGLDGTTDQQAVDEPKTIEEQQAELDAKSEALESEFLELADMTPAERIRAKALEELGLTEEGLENLPADEREAIEDQIAEAIMRSLGMDEMSDSSETTAATAESDAAETKDPA